MERSAGSSKTRRAARVAEIVSRSPTRPCHGSSGIAFLSGGQCSKLGSAQRHERRVEGNLWVLTFSFARAIQQPALELWHGQEGNVRAAQQALAHRARCKAEENMER